MQNPNQDNPYAAGDVPDGGTEPFAPDEPPPTYRLFTPRAVAISSFIGSSVAGGIVMAINYYRVGKRGESAAAVIGSVLLLIVLAVGMAFAPQAESAPATLVGLVQATLMYVAAQSLQGTLLEKHVARGGPLESGWLGAGIGCLTGILLAVVLIGGLSLLAMAIGEDVTDFF